MKKTPFIILSSALVLAACSKADNKVTSPDGKIAFSVENTADGLFYTVTDGADTVVAPSRLGFELRNGENLTEFDILGASAASADTTWETVWGESRLVRDNHNELLLNMKDRQTGLLVDLQVRVFDDGFGFRYVFPEQQRDSLVIMKELTEFNVPAGSTVWALSPESYSYEGYYEKTPVAEIDTVRTPLTMQAPGRYISIHEANLTDYPKMNIVRTGASTLTASLVPWSDGVAAYLATPSRTPWRTMIIGDKPGDLVTSYLTLNLNEPQAFEDASWCKPMKYMGVWWEMHLDKGTWYAGPRHSANTANVKKYIDFCSENGIPGLLVEGWNIGWEGDWPKNQHFDFTKPYDDFDIDEITRYAAEKGVKIIGHHETAAWVTNYENQLDDAFDYYTGHGINDVKTGYVNYYMDGKEDHSSQYGVRHYRKGVETAINNHEPVMPTGIQRTYPNLMSQEGVRGQEWSAWDPDGGNKPEHTVVMPFTRGLAGPMDFTFGTFNFDNPNHPESRVQTTLAKELALYVVIYAPLQMASDLPENYAAHPDAFQFIKDVPTDWEKTVVADAVIGDYVVTARQDRNSSDWYLGAVTDEESRTLDVPLSFLEPGVKYEATIYADAPDADWKTNPAAYVITKELVDSDKTLKLNLAAGGGAAVRFAAMK